MRKSLTKIICMVVMLIMGLGIFCACNDDDYRNERNGEPEAGEFYTLQKAYDNGWLSKGDLRNIAYHRTGDAQKKGFKPTPKNPEELSPETIQAIKENYARCLNGDGESNFMADYISILEYYGTYDGLVVVMLDARGLEYFQAIVERNIGGIEFVYKNSNEMTIWKTLE